MDGADDDYCGPPRMPFQDPGTSQRHRIPYQTFSNSGTQPPRHDPRLQGTFGRISSLDQQEIDLAYMRGQFNLHRELQMRRRFVREQHEQIFSRLLHSNQQPSTSTPLLRHQQPRQHTAEQQTSPGASPLLQSHQYGVQDFATSPGHRLLQGDPAYLQRAAAQQQQQQELLRMMRSQVNGSSSDHRFLEISSQINRQRSSSIASSDKPTEKQRKQSIGSIGDKKRKRTDSSESETKSKAKHGAPEKTKKKIDTPESNHDPKPKAKPKEKEKEKEKKEEKVDGVAVIVEGKKDLEGNDKQQEDKDKQEVIVTKEINHNETTSPAKVAQKDDNKKEQNYKKIQCNEVIDIADETNETPIANPMKDISLLLLASEEVDQKDFVLEMQNHRSTLTFDRLHLLTVASDSIEAFENDVRKSDDKDLNQNSELDVKETDEINHEEIEVVSPSDENVEDENEKVVFDKNDSVMYVVKNMFPGFVSKLPILTCEPEYIENGALLDSQRSLPESGIMAEIQAENSKLIDGLSPSYLGHLLHPSTEMAVTGPLEIPIHSDASQKPIVYKAPVDTWWPSNNTIRRERRLQGYRSDEDEDEKKRVKLEKLPGLAPSMYERLSNHIEPGVLEKLPHCTIHQNRVEQQKHHPNPGPLFCTQVTEAYSNELMLCCSVCHTWRHAACGGHYTKFKPHTSKDENHCVKPICDRCYKENTIVSEFPQAQARMKRQRIENLRRALSTTSVVRQFSFAKHGGTYKWPLGSVSATHIGGHTRSVHVRHERSEKQWGELAMKLGNGLGYRPKERVKVRTRELERLIVSVEDAETETDRHNMMLFLQNECRKQHPVGFERSFGNFFDPADDITNVEEDNMNDDTKGETVAANDKDKVESNLKPEDSNNKKDCNDDQKDTEIGSPEKETLKTYESDTSQNSLLVDCSTSFMDEKSEDSKSTDGSCTPSLEDDDLTRNDTKKRNMINWNTEQSGQCKKVESSSKVSLCLNRGCRRRPRFDSVFCSDSCGVAALERDLLHSFEYASDIHPSLLRT